MTEPSSDTRPRTTTPRSTSVHAATLVARCGLVALLVVACDAGLPGTSQAPGETEAPADSAAGEVGFELAGANDAALVVPVMIDGRGPFRFVLDTGATLTCVDAALADSLALRDQTGVRGYGAGVGGQGAVRLVELDSMSVGAASATDVPACVLDLAGFEQIGLDVDGLVGLNFLSAFRMTLDFEREVLILQAP